MALLKDLESVPKKWPDVADLTLAGRLMDDKDQDGMMPHFVNQQDEFDSARGGRKEADPSAARFSVTRAPSF